MKIELLKPYAKNAKLHKPAQIKLIAESINRFGFDSPIIIDKNNEIIAGHGRLEAAKLLGLKDVPVVLKENLTDEEVKAYRLADNKIAESEWDMGLAIEELKGLSPEMFDLTGFDRNDIDTMINEEQINELSKAKDIDLGRYAVLTVEAPESPRLKARMSFYSRNEEEFEKLKDYFKKSGGELDIDKLVNMIKI